MDKICTILREYNKAIKDNQLRTEEKLNKRILNVLWSNYARNVGINGSLARWYYGGFMLIDRRTNGR